MHLWPATMLHTCTGAGRGAVTPFNRGHPTVQDSDPYLQWQVRVFLLLTHLETGQVRVFQLQTVLLLKILSYCALHSLPILQLQREPRNYIASG